MGGGGTGQADGQLAGGAGGGAGGARAGGIDGGEDGLRFVEKHGAAGGQGGALGMANEQLETELAFERAYLQAQGRLLHAEAFGGAGKMLRLGDGDKIAQVA